MLQVSANCRFFVHDDGSPFCYLGDTAWELFHRLTIGEAEHYLRDRAMKGFTVIQAVALAEIDGLHTPNMRGDLPLAVLSLFGFRFFARRSKNKRGSIGRFSFCPAAIRMLPASAIPARLPHPQKT